jgi:hypothetical protein
MAFDGQFFARALEVLFPLAFAAFVLLRRSTPFPSWAKGLAIGAAITGLIAAALGFLLPYYRELGLTDDDYVVLMRLKRTLVGVVIGIVISIVVACERPKSRESGERSV